MTIASKTLLTLGVSAFAFFSMGTAYAQVPSAAQTTADPGRIDQQIKAPDLSSDVTPAVSGQGAPSQKVPAGADTITFILKNISVEGASAYSESDIASLYADRIGQTVSLADIYSIAHALTQKYRNDGYILTQIVVPPQTIEGGNIRLRAVEGFIDRVTVQGEEDDTSLNLIRTYAQRIQQDGTPLNVKSLERALLLINDLPGVSARSILSPSTSKTGAADLTIIVDRTPLDALASFNNYGSRFLGPYQVGGAASLNSLLGFNERITTQIVVSPDTDQGKELGYYSLAYSQPIGTYGTIFDASFSYTDTDPGFTLDAFDVEGQSSLYKIGLTHPIIRTRNFNLAGRLSFDARNVNSKNIIEPTRRDHIRALRAGARTEFLDTVLGLGINTVDVEFSQGLGLFGASDKNDANLTRASGDPRFFKAEFEAQRLQRLVKGFNLLAGATGQLSSGALLSSEEIGVGGMSYGRGFDPSEIVGDEGIIGKLELQWSPEYDSQGRYMEDYHLFTFIDAGRVWNDDATIATNKRNSATSAGLGIRTEFIEDINADFTVAFPLNRDIQTQGDDDPRFLFGLRKGF